MNFTSFAASDVIQTVMSLPTPGAVFDIVETDSFRLAAINQAALSLIQAETADPTGMLITQFNFSANAASSLQAMAVACARSSKTGVFEESFVLRDGNTVHLSITLVPLVKSDEVQQLVLTAVEITELVNLRRRRSSQLTLFASAFVKTCAWCGNVESEGRWVSARDFVAASGPVEVAYCPDCR